jgi:hypothetical protein
VSLDERTADELLAMVLGGDSHEEVLTAIADDLNVLWLAQQSDSLEPAEFGLFLVRLKARVDIAAELASRARKPASTVPPTTGDRIPEDFWRRLEALEKRMNPEPAVKLQLVKPVPESGPFAGGPTS